MAIIFILLIQSFIIPLVQEEYDKQHNLANQLLNISFKEWDKYGYIYNQLKSQDRIKLVKENADDIVIEFDATRLTQQNFQLLQQIPSIIKESGEVGEFELDMSALGEE